MHEAFQSETEALIHDTEGRLSHLPVDVRRYRGVMGPRGDGEWGEASGCLEAASRPVHRDFVTESISLDSFGVQSI